MTDLPSDRVAPRHPEAPHGPTGSAAASLARIWGRIRRPIDPYGAVEALLGLPSRTAREFISAVIAGSDEATALIHAMPALIRGLSISTVSVPARMVGEVRGPILWSETLTARSSAAGDPGVFVCATVSRAYDTPANRLLVRALDEIRRGGRTIDRLARHAGDDHELLVAARHNGDLATRYLDHRTLSGVPVELHTRRSRSLVRGNQRRRSYQPVLDMLDRATEPLAAPDLRPFCDDRTTGQHDLLAAIVDHVERRGMVLPPFLVVDHSLVAGPITYRHPDQPAGHGPPGITVAGARVDTPDRKSDSSSDPDVTVVSGRRDLVAFVDAAVFGG